MIIVLPFALFHTFCHGQLYRGPVVTMPRYVHVARIPRAPALTIRTTLFQRVDPVPKRVASLF